MNDPAVASCYVTKGGFPTTPVLQVDVAESKNSRTFVSVHVGALLVTKGVAGVVTVGVPITYVNDVISVL